MGHAVEWRARQRRWQPRSRRAPAVPALAGRRAVRRFCTACGQPRGGPAPFCTACGALFAGPPFSGAGPGPPGGPAQGGPETGWHAAACQAQLPGLGNPAAGRRPTRTWETGRTRGPTTSSTACYRPKWPPRRAGSDPPNPGAARSGPVPNGALATAGATAGRRRPSGCRIMAVAVLLAVAGTGAWLVFRHPHASGSRRRRGQAGPAQGRARVAPNRRRPPAPPCRRRQAPAAGWSPWPRASPRQAPEPRVVAYLDDYFTAINRHSYRRFAVLLGAQMRQADAAQAGVAARAIGTTTRLWPPG